MACFRGASRTKAHDERLPSLFLAFVVPFATKQCIPQPLCAGLLVRMWSSVESRSEDEGYRLPLRSLCGLPPGKDEGHGLHGLTVGKDTGSPAAVCDSPSVTVHVFTAPVS